MKNFLLLIEYPQSTIKLINEPEFHTTKFINDSCNYNSQYYNLIFTGVLFGSGKTRFNSQNTPVNNFLIDEYRKKGINFIKDLRGTYWGILQDKQTNNTYIFTDQVAMKQLFYYQLNNHLLVTDNIYVLTKHLKANSISFSLNEQAAYFSLTYGYWLENNTLIQNVNKLTAGNYLKVINGKTSLIKYFAYTNKPNEQLNNPKEAIEGIDHYFRQAIERQFNKDIEYNLKHAVTLSAGLDSRMTTWVAHDMGYTKQLNLTFSQSGSKDHQIAQDIAAYLNHEWLYKQLDGGHFLMDIDPVLAYSFGSSFLLGLSHSRAMYKYLNWDNLGILHTGQLGDAVIGTFYSSLDNNKPYQVSDGTYSRFLIHRINPGWIKETYDNEEIFKLYTRGFTGANQGLLTAQQYTETHSPFYDLDFLNFCYSIPVKQRYLHRIYHSWLKEKYPDACRYVWGKSGKKPGKAVPIIEVYNKHIVLDNITGKIFNKTKLNSISKAKKMRLENRSHMNPIAYWYKTSNELRHAFNSYFTNHINLLKNYPVIFHDVEQMFKQGTVFEKHMVITLLSALKHYQIQ